MYVERDYPNLRIAASEAFEQGWAWHGAMRTLRRGRVADQTEFLQRVIPQRSLAEGYYAWIDYLIWLSATHDIVPFRELSAIEVEGIKIIRAARDKFLSDRVRCGKCGSLNDKHALACSECGERFKE